MGGILEMWRHLFHWTQFYILQFSYSHGEVMHICTPMVFAFQMQICNHLAREVDMLQAQAQPALEELTNNADQVSEQSFNYLRRQMLTKPVIFCL